MRSRFLTSLSVLTVVMVASSLGTINVAGQAPKAAASKATKTVPAAKPWTPPRTPWGDPDLQGIYNNATGTPLQRPSKFDKPVLSEEEAGAYQEQLRQTINTDNTPRDQVGNYNELWFDQQRKELRDKRTSLIVDPPDGRIPPRVSVTPEQQKRIDAVIAANQRFYAGIPYSWLDLEPAIRCIIRTDRPPYLGIIYNNTQQIFQSPGYVAIASEMIHSSRIIPLDNRPHLASDLKQWLGDPRGHWEGDTLVVETTNVRKEGTYGYAEGGALGETTGANPETYKIIERFTRVDANTLKYEFTISDPQTWTKPWTAMVPWKMMDAENPDYQLYEYACHEDNYDIVHFLGRARLREKAGEADIRKASKEAGYDR